MTSTSLSQRGAERRSGGVMRALALAGVAAVSHATAANASGGASISLVFTMPLICWAQIEPGEGGDLATPALLSECNAPHTIQVFVETPQGADDGAFVRLGGQDAPLVNGSAVFDFDAAPRRTRRLYVYAQQGGQSVRVRPQTLSLTLEPH